jgi:hypothetical protein
VPTALCSGSHHPTQFATGICPPHCIDADRLFCAPPTAQYAAPTPNCSDSPLVSARTTAPMQPSDSRPAHCAIYCIDQFATGICPPHCIYAVSLECMQCNVYYAAPHTIGSKMLLVYAYTTAYMQSYHSNCICIKYHCIDQFDTGIYIHPLHNCSSCKSQFHIL